MFRLKSSPDLVHLSKSKLWTVFSSGKEIEIVSYYFDTKKTGDSISQTVSAPGGQTISECLAHGDWLICRTSSSVLYTTLKAAGEFKSILIPANLGSISSMKLSGSYLLIESGSTVLNYKITEDGVKTREETSALYSDCPGLKVKQDCTEKGTDSEGFEYCSVYSDDVLVSFQDRDQVVKIAEKRGKLEKVWAECNADPDAFQLILGFEDGSLISVTPRGNIMFVREEGLASIQKVELVGMGFQDQDFQMKLIHTENIFDPTGLAQNFINRIKRHVSHFHAFISSIANFRLSEKTKAVTPDRFGLKKIIVAVTEFNKMYGIDSMSGDILWQTMFPGEFNPTVPFYQPQTFLLVQKDGRAGDYAQGILVYKRARSVHYMLSFNPLNGEVQSNEPTGLVLDQAILLPELPDHELKPVLLIGKDGSAVIHPANAINCLKTGPALYVATKPEPGKLVGKKVVVTNSDQIILSPVWSLMSPNTDIIAIDQRHPDEHVHTAGRVLADRSVLFKYMNPNLSLVLAQGLDSTAKIFINVYLIDMVTGRIFYSASHKKVLPPFHLTHSENWGVYTFFNDKARRTELVSLELYEGKSQSNASVFSSIEDLVNPLVERQAYILPTSDVTALRETMTEQGITSKHLLIGTSLGSIVDLPLLMVDPRRPPLDSPVHVREPGIPPYIPELPFPHDSILNYNQTILGVKNIVTSASGLESTTLVFVYGLDIYGTRVTPSKGFDLLKEDFDYLMITSVILGLALACFITRKLSQKKMLSQAWK